MITTRSRASGIHFIPTGIPGISYYTHQIIYQKTCCFSHMVLLLGTPSLNQPRDGVSKRLSLFVDTVKSPKREEQRSYICSRFIYDA